MYEKLVKALRTCSERDSCFWLGDTCPYFNSELCDDKSGKAADAIEELQKPKWIPVTERLPENDRNVLCDDEGGVTVGYYIDEEVGWHDMHCYKIFPTHWMPLPQPPESEGE